MHWRSCGPKRGVEIPCFMSSKRLILAESATVSKLGSWVYVGYVPIPSNTYETSIKLSKHQTNIDKQDNPLGYWKFPAFSTRKISTFWPLQSIPADLRLVHHATEARLLCGHILVEVPQGLLVTFREVFKSHGVLIQFHGRTSVDGVPVKDFRENPQTWRCSWFFMGK